MVGWLVQERDGVSWHLVSVDFMFVSCSIGATFRGMRNRDVVENGVLNKTGLL